MSQMSTRMPARIRPAFLLRILLVAAVLLAVTLPIVLIQYELLRPGIDLGEPRRAMDMYENVRGLHADFARLILSGAFVLAAVFSIGRAILKDRKIAIPVAACFVVSTVLGIFGLMHLARVSVRPIPVGVILSILLLITAISLIAAARHRRLELCVLTFPALMTTLWGSLIFFVESHAGVDGVLLDTWYVTARAHAFGLSMILSGLAILAAGAAIAGRVHSITVNLGLTVAICVSGVWMVTRQLGLGLNGMPRRYIDYADIFSDGHYSAGLAGFILLLLAIGSAVRFLFFGRKPPTAEAAF
ncbi:hypothetical protein [Henriciella marina]|uniref:hypothetical protein n=1 Tax=Henriciella marina TaxID=453851 RepID=UPI000377FA89|nr:hypothetical protein [Henriciella marina]